MSELNITGPGQVTIGKRCKVASDVQFVFHSPGSVHISDYCTIGSGVKFVCDGGDITLGDWTSVHDRSLLLSGKGLEVGQHCWFGQHCVIDGTGFMSIGNGVRVGMYSQLWSHVAAGEQLEGCTLFGTRPVHIEDDVWLVGTCFVAPGVTIGKQTVALIGSNITKSFPAHSVLAGSPAALKEKMQFYTAVTMEQKWNMLREWTSTLAQQFELTMTEQAGKLIVLARDTGPKPEYVCFVFDESKAQGELEQYPAATVCDLATKKYRKMLTDLEALVLKSLAGNKARFYI